jgi:hypothetical protein
MLTEEDADFLAEQGWRYELQPEGELVNLIIFSYELPPGYDSTHVDLLIRLPGGFPDAAPDMFWFDPPVRYPNGGEPPGAGERGAFAQRTWQRWSRHLGGNEWRPGIDNLKTYLRFVRTNLERAVPAAA